MMCYRRWEGKGERQSELAETGNVRGDSAGSGARMRDGRPMTQVIRPEGTNTGMTDIV